MNDGESQTQNTNTKNKMSNANNRTISNATQTPQNQAPTWKKPGNAPKERGGGWEKPKQEC
jgi:hypothetical protein